MKYSQDLKKVIAFHGHVCPGLAYGYRVAVAAMEAIGTGAGDEDLVAVVENDSCAVDAIQVITSCTFGKGNLIHLDYGKQAYTFHNRATGKSVRFSIVFEYEETGEDKAIWKRFLAGERTPEVEGAMAGVKDKKIRAILSAPPKEVIAAAHAAGAPPPEARIYPSVRCTVCGEKVMEPRARVRKGAIVCIPCAGM